MKRITKTQLTNPTLKAAFEAGKLCKKDTSSVIMTAEALSRLQTSMKNVSAGLEESPLSKLGWPVASDVLTADQLKTLSELLEFQSKLQDIELSLVAFVSGKLSK